MAFAVRRGEAYALPIPISKVNPFTPEQERENQMEDLPRIDPPFTGTPPAPGVKFRDKAGFTYEMIERAPHTNRDGTQSWLLSIRGTCADCGTLFIAKQGPSRKNLPRRCPAHAAGKGPEKTYPWGSAPTGGSGKADWELVQRFLYIWGQRIGDENPKLDPGFYDAMELFAKLYPNTPEYVPDASDLLA